MVLTSNGLVADEKLNGKSRFRDSDLLLRFASHESFDHDDGVSVAQGKTDFLSGGSLMHVKLGGNQKDVIVSPEGGWHRTRNG